MRLFIGAALISLSPVWVKLVEVSPTTSGFYRVLIGGMALAIYMLVRRQRLQFSRNAWLMIIVAAVFLTLDLWFWHRSIIYIGPGLATLLANFQVFFMMLAGIVLLRQMPRPIQLVAVPMALLGLALIVGLDWNGLPPDYQLGIILGFMTAVVYAAYLLSLRHVRQQSSHRLPTRELVVISLLTAAMLGVTALLEGESLVINSLSDVGWLVGYGLLSHSLGWLFIASSLPQVTAVEAGLALMLQPTLSFGWDVLFFDRPMTSVELVGAAIALVAIYLGSRPASKQAQGAR
ncbi:MAG: DMT family transporter [Proteobacteria bacterium]|nr:DMT family transporter [Pseudomonadota bacterium]